MRAGLDIRDFHPDERFAEQRIVFFDVIGEKRLVVSSNEAQIATIVLRPGELKIAIMQSNQHHRRSDRIRDAAVLRRGIQGNLLTDGPLAVPPPGMSRATHCEKCQGDPRQIYQKGCTSSSNN